MPLLFRRPASRICRTCTQRDTPLFTKAGLQQKDEQQELDGFLVLPTDCFSPL